MLGVSVLTGLDAYGNPFHFNDAFRLVPPASGLRLQATFREKVNTTVEALNKIAPFAAASIEAEQVSP